MFKDSYLLDYINVEDIDESDPIDIDEAVIEKSIVMNIKNFIMTFGKSFTYKGHQVHYDKLGHDHWIDLLFFNRELQALVVVELKKAFTREVDFFPKNVDFVLISFILQMNKDYEDFLIENK